MTWHSYNQWNFIFILYAGVKKPFQFLHPSYPVLPLLIWYSTVWVGRFCQYNQLTVKYFNQVHLTSFDRPIMEYYMLYVYNFNGNSRRVKSEACNECWWYVSWHFPHHLINSILLYETDTCLHHPHLPTNHQPSHSQLWNIVPIMHDILLHESWLRRSSPSLKTYERVTCNLSLTISRCCSLRTVRFSADFRCLVHISTLIWFITGTLSASGKCICYCNIEH